MNCTEIWVNNISWPGFIDLMFLSEEYFSQVPLHQSFIQITVVIFHFIIYSKDMQ